MKPLDLERFEGATEGPWQDRINDRALCVYAENGRPIALVREFDRCQTEDGKNARLIAAAPQLLAELKDLRAWRQQIAIAYARYALDRSEMNIRIKSFTDAIDAAETELKDATT
jgi:hypothetical protein